MDKCVLSIVFMSLHSLNDIIFITFIFIGFGDILKNLLLMEIYYRRVQEEFKEEYSTKLTHLNEHNLRKFEKRIILVHVNVFLILQ